MSNRNISSTDAAQQAIIEAQRSSEELFAERTKKPKVLRPAVVNVTIDWTDIDTDEDHTTSLAIRVLNFDEEIRAALVCSRLAMGLFDSLPYEDNYFIRALATCNVMWPDLPAGLKKLLEEDKDLTISLYNNIIEHKNARFQGDVREGGGRKAKIRLEVDPGGLAKQAATSGE